MIRINNTQRVHFLEQADALRRSGLLCDAVISVRNQIFRAHRLVLACASRRLAEQLALGGGDGPVRCTLESFSPRTFKQVLDFTYARALEVTRDDLQLLLRAAEVLEMQLLEEECRKHLESIRGRGGGGGAAAANDGGERSGGDPRGSPLPGEKREEASDGVVVEDVSPPAPEGDPEAPRRPPEKAGLRPPPEKARSPPSPAAPFDRVSVISRHTGGGGPFPAPWTFPAAWKSVSALRRLADCSGLVPFRPLQHPDQPAMLYPFAAPPPHVFPLLGSHFQSSAAAHSDLHSAYARGLGAGSAGIGGIIKQGLLKRKKSQRSYDDEPETSTDPGRHRCPDGEPRLRNTSGESGGGRLTGSAHVARQQSHQQEHKAGKPHQCQHCPKKFSLKHQLDTHHRVHTGEKPFECRLCGQRSRDYSAMIKHLRTHNGASPYRCTVCLEFCSSLVAMQRHVKNHAVQDFPSGWNISSTYLYNSYN